MLLRHGDGRFWLCVESTWRWSLFLSSTLLLLRSSSFFFFFLRWALVLPSGWYCRPHRRRTPKIGPENWSPGLKGNPVKKMAENVTGHQRSALRKGRASDDTWRRATPDKKRFFFLVFLVVFFLACARAPPCRIYFVPSPTSPLPQSPSSVVVRSSLWCSRCCRCAPDSELRPERTSLFSSSLPLAGRLLFVAVEYSFFFKE
jgi:hypothetical protein